MSVWELSGSADVGGTLHGDKSVFLGVWAVADFELHATLGWTYDGRLISGSALSGLQITYMNC